MVLKGSTALAADIWTHPCWSLVQIAALSALNHGCRDDRVGGVRASFLGHRDHDPVDSIDRAFVIDERLGSELLDGDEAWTRQPVLS